MNTFVRIFNGSPEGYWLVFLLGMLAGMLLCVWIYYAEERLKKRSMANVIDKY